jgi:hypothetical protein
MPVFLKRPTSTSNVIKCVRNDKKTQFCTQANGLLCKTCPALPTLSLSIRRTTMCNLICNVNVGVIFSSFIRWIIHIIQIRSSNLTGISKSYCPTIHKTLYMHTFHPHLRKIQTQGLLYTKFRITVHIIQGTPTELPQVTPTDNGPSWAAHSHSTSKEILSFTKHKISPSCLKEHKLELRLCHTNSVHVLTPYFININYIILPPTSRWKKLSLSFQCSH